MYPEKNESRSKTVKNSLQAGFHKTEFEYKAVLGRRNIKKRRVQKSTRLFFMFLLTVLPLHDVVLVRAAFFPQHFFVTDRKELLPQ